MSFNLGALFERVADAVPDREAVVTPARRLTFAALEERANRLAHHLAGAGVRAGEHVGLQLLNGTEYIEAMLAAFKLRAVPVNVNYRYVDGELRYLYTNAELVALVHHRSFAPRVAAVLPRVRSLRHILVVDDGSHAEVSFPAVDYEAALAGASAQRDFRGRSGDDLYIAYTGGTTGMPKGVMWRHEDIFFAGMGGGDPTTVQGPITTPDELPERMLPFGVVMLLAPPLMHVSAQWGAFSSLFGGSTVVLTKPGPFDAHEVLATVETEHVNILTLVGDAMARPLLDVLRVDPHRYDTSSLFVLASGGAVLSAVTKAEIAELLSHVITIDGYGSTETGVLGTRARMPGTEIEGATKFTVNDRTAVLDDALERIQPGSPHVGVLARRGHVPLGYFNDPAGTAKTFVDVKGERWALTGDTARVDDDGTIVLLGRGSTSINTGGEKVYPEEVEGAVKSHPAVYDAVIVGVPDDRWGERVAAVASLRPRTTLALAELRQHCRPLLADYKLPRELHVVDSVERTPSGKADYAWARAQVAARAAAPA